MLEISSITDLAAMLRKQHATNVVGIEGFSGSGKTFLARELAQNLRISVVSTDKYVMIKDGDIYYSDRLNLVSLRNDIHRVISVGHPDLLRMIFVDYLRTDALGNDSC